jgi:hypothetical protein
MRSAMVIALALAFSGCADGESGLEPRTPVNAQLFDPTTMRAPDIADGFPQVFAMTEENTPPALRPGSISLGYIGDAPLGTQPTPPHTEPYWTRPFPCHWTGTCQFALPYAVPYLGMVVGVVGPAP